METCVRAFIFDEDDNLLLVRNASDQLWVLPGGHTEEEETIYQTLEREIHEELGLDINILWSETVFSDRNVVAYPLPVSIRKVKYEHRNKGMVQKLEFDFFARSQGVIELPNDSEIYDYQWISQDDFLAMEAGVETWRSMQEILEQNQELLELL